MSYSDPGPIYRRCIMCGRCELLRNRAKFCTVQCYSASRCAFSKALADGQLEHVLKTVVSKKYQGQMLRLAGEGQLGLILNFEKRRVFR